MDGGPAIGTKHHAIGSPVPVVSRWLPCVPYLLGFPTLGIGPRCRILPARRWAKSLVRNGFGMVADLGRMVGAMAGRIDHVLAEQVTPFVRERYYHGTALELEHVARDTFILDAEGAGRMGVPAFTTVRAGVDDVPGIVHAQLEAVRFAYRDLPVAQGKEGVPALYRDMAGRKPQEYERAILRDTDTMLIHRTSDGTVGGFSWFSKGENGEVEWIAWHLLEEFRSTGLSNALLRRTLLEAGDVDIYTQTTVGTKAQKAFEKLGFRRIGEPTDTPPPMAQAGLHAPQQRYFLDREGRRRLLNELLGPPVEPLQYIWHLADSSAVRFGLAV